MASPNHSTPIGFDCAEPVNFHECDQAPSASPLRVATTASRAVSPDQPPTCLRPSSTSGKKPNTMRKNCRTSL